MSRVDWVKEHFRYDPETGLISYDTRDGVAHGWLHSGYIRASKFGVYIYAHQVAFAIMENYIPKEIDHEDLNRSNNKWSNLRVADHCQNSANCAARRTNKTKMKGVSWSKSNNCWRMDIQFRKVKYHSYHSTQDAAYKAYCEMSAKLHGEFSNVG